MLLLRLALLRGMAQMTTNKMIEVEQIRLVIAEAIGSSEPGARGHAVLAAIEDAGFIIAPKVAYFHDEARRGIMSEKTRLGAAEAIRKHREYCDGLPRALITPRDFHELLDYSASIPTGTTPGKKWKRLDGVHDYPFKAAGGQPRWISCQYDPNCPPEAKQISIHRYRPIIKIRAAIGERS